MLAIIPEANTTLMMAVSPNISIGHSAPSAREKLKAGGRNKIEPATRESASVAIPGQKPPAKAMQITAMPWVVKGEAVDRCGCTASRTSVAAVTIHSETVYM